jgi:hypothetical protein
MLHNFPRSVFLDDEATTQLIVQLPGIGISGGSVYDALVGHAAVTHRLPLVTRDQRALRV